MLQPIRFSQVILLALMAPPAHSAFCQQAPSTSNAQAGKSLGEQLRLKLTPDSNKAVLACFAAFSKASDQVNLSDFDTNYGSERGVKTLLDTVRDTMDTQKDFLSTFGGKGISLDPLLAVDLLDTVHQASELSLMFAMMPSNASNKARADLFLNANRSCNDAHKSLRDYLKASIVAN